MDFAKILGRVQRAVMLDSQLYEEVEHDQNALPEAAVVVVVASVLSGLGALFFQGPMAFLGGILAALVGWVIWSLVTFVVGTSLFGGKADVQEMLRVLGYAYAPMCLGLIPILGTIVGFFWTIATFVVAIRQGLDFTTGKAVGTMLVGLLVYICFGCVMTMLFGGMGAMFS